MSTKEVIKNEWNEWRNNNFSNVHSYGTLGASRNCYSFNNSFIQKRKIIGGKNGKRGKFSN